jgi:oligopeptide/dipeptide ABC transporter ATP-binding protein
MGLLASLPRMDDQVDALTSIRGNPPDMAHPPAGCAFHPRCPLARQRCREERPALRDLGGGRHSACHFDSELIGTDPAALFSAASAAADDSASPNRGEVPA